MGIEPYIFDMKQKDRRVAGQWWDKKERCIHLKKMARSVFFKRAGHNL